MKYNKPKSNSRAGKKKIPVPRIPKNYFWDICELCRQDLQEYLPSHVNHELSRIIRDRGVDCYMQLAEDIGPQCIAHCDMSLVNFRTLYLFSALLKKVPFDTGLDRKSAALEKFHAAESNCLAYNQFGYTALSNSSDREVRHSFTYAISFIKKVLGEDVPRQSELLWSRHGPGATCDTVLGRTSQYDKFINWPYSVSRRAFRHGVALLNDDLRWLGALEDDFRSFYNIDRHRILDRPCFHRNVMYENSSNRITTVPKSYKIDRTIAIEPTMNLFLQLGVDGFIRKRLKRWDIDLDDQSKNQELARRASITGDFATIDLKAASDSIALKLCELLLPRSWYTYLCDLRSPYGEVDGEIISYEKISSMGNGYTFALESLIFGSLLYGCLRTSGSHTSIRDCAVYGDDLIVPTSCVDLVERVFNAAGFSFNKEKSFSSSPFRESCGADWYHGEPVRPVFLKKLPSSIPDLYLDYNRLKRLFNLWYPELEEPRVLDYIKKLIPIDFRFIGPISDESFDAYLHSNTSGNSRFRRGVWEFQTLKSITHEFSGNKFYFRKLMNYLRKTDTSSASGSSFKITRRNSTRLAKMRSTASYWQHEYTPLIVPSFSKKRY